MANPLTAGFNVIINQKVGATNTPIYPFTRTANVKDVKGRSLDEIIDTLATKDYGNYVPDFSSETASSLRFLRNDNTWANIQAASTTQAGVVQLESGTNVADDTKAATAGAVKAVKDVVDSLKQQTSDDFVKKTQLGAKSTGDTVGVATLDTNGFVPASQLPSYVDDVVEIELISDTEAHDATGHTITPESGKIYVACLGEAASEKTYRWSGTRFSVISETLALGTTESTAFDGARGLVAYTHSQAAHARVDATLTEKSEKNGYIKINGSETVVYVHPQAEGASSTNPHGTTAADVGLGKVENKTPAEILAEMTKDQVVAALKYTPANEAVLATAANAGMMSAAYAAKLDNCMETAVGQDAPTFTNGIWFEVVTSDVQQG